MGRLSSTLETCNPNLPSRQVEALAKLPEKDQAAAYREAYERSGGYPSTDEVEAMVDTYLAADEPYEPEEAEDDADVYDQEAKGRQQKNRAPAWRDGRQVGSGDPAPSGKKLCYRVSSATAHDSESPPFLGV